MSVDTFDYIQCAHVVMAKFSTIRIDEEQYSYLANNLSTFPYIIDYSGICRVYSKKTSDNYSYWIAPVSSYLLVKKKMISVEGSKVNLLIEYFNGDAIKEKLFEREAVLSKGGVKLLLGCGISFEESHSEFLLNYLLKSDMNAEIEYYHNRLGWDTDVESGIPFFKLNRSLCQKGTLPYTSKYAGDLDIEPRGNAETWLNLIKESVLPYTPLTFCMLLGFAAPILSLLYEKYDLGSLVFSLSNDSSKGKTTAASLAASVFSNPVLGKGTVQNFNSSVGYLSAFLSSTSLCVVLDEGSTYSDDFNKLFYKISSGRDKGRLTKDCEMKEPCRWNCIVITTAEFIPIDDNSPNGLRTRCFCITDDLTVNAEHADKIKTTISRQSYGAVGVQFIEWLLNFNDLNIEADYLECKGILFQALQESGASEGSFTSRAFSRLAVILQTADYVAQCFSLEINMNSLIQYIVGLERKINVETDIVQKFIDDILSEISCSSARYISKNNINPSNVLGKIEENDDSTVISITMPEFKRICKKFDTQPVIILKKLKERGLLESESDRLSRRVKLGPDIPEMACYILKIKTHKAKTNKNNLIPV